MSKRAEALAQVGVMMTGFMAAPLAAQEVPGDVSVAKDMTAVIALQGLPCGKVVNATKQAENDYIVLCESGNRYRVLVNADGRVIVEKRD